MAARWGSFLQQAVTGIEARLDTILAEEEAKANTSPSTAATATTSAASAPASASAAAPASAAASAPPKPSPGPSRSGSTNRAQDRLQERLARAVAAKNAAAGIPKPDPSPSRLSFTSSPRQSLEVASRASTDGAEPSSQNAQGTTSSPRVSQDATKRPSLDAADGSAPAQGSQAQLRDKTGTSQSEDTPEMKQDSTGGPSRKSTDSTLPTPQLEITPVAPDTPLATTDLIRDPLPSPGIQLDLPSDPSQRQQEEIPDHVEKIDALQAKLQYLAREAAEVAKRASQEAPAGSLEKKLADKDYQIALLMEEGKNLGVTEQKHRTMLKKLRAKLAEDEKEITDLKAARAKADADAEMLRRRSRRADDMEKFHEESLKRIGQLQRDINGLRSDAAAKDATISDLRSQLQKAAENAEALTAKLNEEALEKERQKTRDLEDQVAALQVEKSLVADRGRAQANDLREKVERASERARVVEVEMKAELQAMEAKLEAMRARAEETSSGALGDSQAKLLRQVETLQTQYAIASDNWQGIEATLLGRIANLEKERDEALQRESDMRKKAREAAVRAKRQEEELEEAMSKLPTAQADIKAYKAELETLRKRADQAEATLQETRADFDRQKAAWKDVEHERRTHRPRDRSESRDRLRGAGAGGGWLLDDMASPSFRSGSYPNLNNNHHHGTSSSRPESPLMAAPPRTWSADLLGFQAVSAGKLRKTSAPSSNGDGGDRGGAGTGTGSSAAAPGRRPSVQPPLHRPSLASASAQSSSSPSFPLHPLPHPHSYHSPTAAGLPLTFSHSAESIPRQGSPHQSSTRMSIADPADPDSTDLLLDEAAAGAAAETGSNPHQVMQDMVSVSTVAAGPSVQLVERMSAQIRRLESEKVAGREELARMSRQRDEARGEIVALMREVESGKAALDKAARLEVEVGEVKARYETTLEMLGEKSELVEELRADVQDVKAMYRDLIERTLK